MVISVLEMTVNGSILSLDCPSPFCSSPFLNTVLDSCYSPAPSSAVSAADDLTCPRAAIAIRHATAADIPRLAEVLTDSFHPPTGVMFWMQPLIRFGIQEDLRARFRADLPQYCCFAAVSHPTEQVIGTVEVSVRPLTWRRYTVEYPYISNLAVHPHYRRRGVARRLLLGCEPKARDWGFEAIYLHVLNRNQPAQQLYQGLGYHIEDSAPNYGGWEWFQPQRLLLYKSLQCSE
jgi:ribosomal protein S18 acetylase RimI-like enzyme